MGQKITPDKDNTFMTKRTTPNYRLIFLDILNEKFPNKKKSCMPLIDKKELSPLDVIKVNRKIFGDGNKNKMALNHKHKAYDKKTIIEILKYQENHRLSNIQTALHFELSRNTVAKWKQQFL
ncbi:helix-turn-helix domain-containing protein [Chryseobacterium joostei]|uniref:helix-turn-helix domain-containing protein n=1 Tax=Chryseobacterium joostei TaxID=112234 RepID=UPI003D1422C5